MITTGSGSGSSQFVIRPRASLYGGGMLYILIHINMFISPSIIGHDSRRGKKPAFWLFPDSVIPFGITNLAGASFFEILIFS